MNTDKNEGHTPNCDREFTSIHFQGVKNTRGVSGRFSSTGFDFESGSFRDRTGRVFEKGGLPFDELRRIKKLGRAFQKDFFVRG
jgi:hypothetical protein